MSKKHPSRVFGHIPGYKSGHSFKNRRELHASGVHAQIRSGIHGNSKPGGGTFSICLIPGKYEDDADDGDQIIYVGSGGRHEKTGEQIADQSFDKPSNKALYISYKTQKPVRVIVRQVDGPKEYNYYGLYIVDSATIKPGKAGFNMCFVELRRIESDDAQVASSSSSSSPSPSPSSSQGS